MLKIEIFPAKILIASVARTIAGASNMKNALNICTLCQALCHSNGCPELDEFFSLFHIFVILSIQIVQDPQKIKTMRQKLIKVQDLSKRNSARNVRLHRPTATRMGS